MLKEEAKKQIGGGQLKPIGFKKYDLNDNPCDDIYDYYDLDEMDFKLNLKGDHDFSTAT